MRNKVLLVEDEKELAKAVKTILSLSKYDVDLSYNGLEALDATKEKNYDAIVMDIMMPEMDGIEALKEMRKSGVKTPVILLTAKSQVSDKVDGLDAGANDYLTKPFAKEELLARIRAVIRTNEENSKTYSIGNITFNKETSELLNSKASFHLNNKECDILELLIKNKDSKISAMDIAHKVWENENIVEESIPMYISYLQNKFVALDSDVLIKEDNGYYLNEIK